VSVRSFSNCLSAKPGPCSLDGMSSLFRIFALTLWWYPIFQLWYYLYGHCTHLVKSLVIGLFTYLFRIIRQELIILPLQSLLKLYKKERTSIRNNCFHCMIWYWRRFPFIYIYDNWSNPLIEFKSLTNLIN